MNYTKWVSYVLSIGPDTDNRTTRRAERLVSVFDTHGHGNM